MKTLFKILASWQHGLKFFGISLLLLTFSLLVALWGVSVGSSFLQEFNAGERPDLATMGELLGGTLAFAVAFAGAWVALKIASRANQTVNDQQHRQASRAVYSTLEKSIGQILATQLELEALLREVGILAAESDRWFEEGLKTHDCREKAAKDAKKRTEDQATRVSTQAQKVSKKMQKLLASPLALAVVLAIGKAKNPKTNEQDILADLGQVPRFLDKLMTKLKMPDARIRYQDARWLSPYDFVRIFSPEQLLDLGGGDLLDEKPGVAGAALLRSVDQLLGELSYLCYFTAEWEEPVRAEIKEPSLWRTLRALVYTPAQARVALEQLFPVEIYGDKKISELLKSRPVRAFESSGMTNDHQIAQKLRDCERITKSIHTAVERPECKQYTPPAVLSRLKVLDRGLEPALKRAERLWNDLPKFGDERPSVGPFCSRLYGKLASRFYQMSKSRWLQLPPFELYHCIFKTLEDYKRKVKKAAGELAGQSASAGGIVDVLQRIGRTSEEVVVLAEKETAEEFSVTSLLSDISRRVDVLDAKGKLDEIVAREVARLREPAKALQAGEEDDRADLTDKGAIREGVSRLAELAVAAAAADLLDGLKIPQDRALDEQELFAELQRGLSKRIVDRALGSLSSAQEADVGRLLEDAAVTPLQVQLAAQACAAQGGAGEFETWLINQLRSAVTHQMQGVVCLAEVQALGGSGRVESNEKEFMVICEKLRDVPDFLASSVTISSEAETDEFVSVEFRMPWFDEAGFAKVPHADAQLKLTKLMLLCGMLGYRKVDPSENFSGAYCKTVRLGINDLHWLRLVILELKLLGTIYCEMAGEPEARDEEVTHL